MRNSYFMSRVLITALLLSLVSLLMSCAPKNSVASEDSQAPADAKDLSVWAWNINVPVLNDAAKAYQKQNPDTKISVTDLGRLDVYTKLTTGFQAGGAGLPDISLIEDDRLQAYLGAFRSQFADLSAMGFDSDLNSKFPAYKKDAVSKDGKAYAFPFDSGPAMIFYRRDIFEAAGVDPASIKTWDDFLEAGKKVKASSGSSMFNISSDDDGPFRVMMNQAGVYYFDQAGDIDFMNPTVISILTKLKEFNDNGIIYTGARGWDGFVQAITNENIVAIPAGGWLAGTIKGQVPDTAGKWAVMELPVSEGMVAAANQGGSNLALLSSSDSLTSGYNYLKFFTTENSMQKLAFENGLFPSLLTISSEPSFQAADSFFSNETIWTMMSKTLTNIRKVNYTNDYPIAQEEILKAYAEVIFNGADPATELAASAQRLASRTGRKVKQY